MELGSNFLSGIFVGALFLIKIWFLIFWVEYVEQEERISLPINLTSDDVKKITAGLLQQAAQKQLLPTMKARLRNENKIKQKL